MMLGSDLLVTMNNSFVDTEINKIQKLFRGNILVINEKSIHEDQQG